MSDREHIEKSLDFRPAQEATQRELLIALASGLIFVLLTRAPFLRPAPFDLDEVGYLDFVQQYNFPPTHTLFLASGKVIGSLVNEPYLGFLILDMLVSALSLVGVWWWLRSLVHPATAAWATLALGVSPMVWSYGAMAANYTAILGIGSVLLGLVARAWRDPRPWQPYLAAAILALGAGYRQDIGLFWLPILALVLWPFRRNHAIPALATFVALNLAWFVPMIHDVGGWHVYRALSSRFAQSAGYRNSVWYLGWVDGPARYAVKLAIALCLTLGPGLALAPRGFTRLSRMKGGSLLAAALLISMMPALAMHLLVHFGVPGYAFHYVPALIAIVALGAARTGLEPDGAPVRLAALATILAAFFLLYPTNYNRGGLRGDFDLAFARYTRTGLATRPPLRVPTSWRTMNSEVLPGGFRTEAPRRSLVEVMSSLGSSEQR